MSETYDNNLKEKIALKNPLFKWTHQMILDPGDYIYHYKIEERKHFYISLDEYCPKWCDDNGIYYNYIKIF